jgi:hypothetical protein
LVVGHRSAIGITDEVLHEYGYFALDCLGSSVYVFAINAILLEELDPAQLAIAGALGRIDAAVYTLASHAYRLGLAHGWARYIAVCGERFQALPESVLLEAFNRSMGAAVLLDLSNLERLVGYLRNAITGDVDFATATVSTGVSKAVRNLASSQLQGLVRQFIDGDVCFGDEMFTYEAQGPCHSQEFKCRVAGDTCDLFTAVSPKKFVANRLSCNKLLEYVCRQAFANEGGGKPSGVGWVDKLVRVMRLALLDEPDDRAWLGLRLDAMPLPNPELWKCVKQAIKDPFRACERALAAMKGAADLSATHKEKLRRLVLMRLRERTAARPMQVIEASLNRLVEADGRSTRDDVIGVMCSCLNLLKCLDLHACSLVPMPNIVSDAIALLSPTADIRIAVPAVLARIDSNMYRNILEQIRSSAAVTGAVCVDVSGEYVRVRCDLALSERMCHEALMLAAWQFCRVPACGFTVERSSAGLAIIMPLVKFVNVTKEGVWSEDNGTDDGGLTDKGEGIVPHVEAGRTALHEIKNIIIASPTRWREELRQCAASFAKAVDVFRAPQIDRCALERVRDIVVETARRASRAYGLEGSVDILYEEEVGWTDTGMVRVVFGNLADNAARSAAKASDQKWAIEGVMTATELDVVVRNTCDDVETAKNRIEGNGLARSDHLAGTGLGIATIKSLAAKLLGKVTYDYLDGQVSVRVVLPTDVVSMAGLLE